MKQALSISYQISSVDSAVSAPAKVQNAAGETRRMHERIGNCTLNQHFRTLLTMILPLVWTSTCLSGERPQGEDTVHPASEKPSEVQIQQLMDLVRSQVEMVNELKQQNEQLGENNRLLMQRLQAIEARVVSDTQKDRQVGQVQASSPLPQPVPSPASSLPAMSPSAPLIIPEGTVETQPPPPLPSDVNVPVDLQAGSPDGSSAAVTGAPPNFTISTHAPSDLDPATSANLAPKSEFLLGRYDNGFILVAPKNPVETPFALRANVVTQERYTGFFRNVESWQPHNFKPAIPVNQRSTFDINRAYLGFSGFALSPKLQFSFILATTSTRNVSYILAVLGYQFSKSFGLYGGYNKVPGTREWFESFKNTMGVDRSMATTFVRPSMSPGVWITGEPIENFHYYAMISNGINSLYQIEDRTNTQMGYSANIWWEPLGVFGPGFADEEFHENPAVRLGSSVVYDRVQFQPNLGGLLENPENTVIRLSNGLPVFLPGAIEPGVQLLMTNDFLWTVDAGLKYRGWGLSGEYYFRWLNNFRTNKPLNHIQSIYDQAGYLQLSYAVIPKTLEFYTRTSLVAGPYGSGNEYGGGLNWYVNKTRKWRTTAEVLQVNRSPANNILTGYRTGESGTLFQLQLLTDF